MNLQFTEEYPEVGASFSLKVIKTLYSKRSVFQQIDVYETEQFGRVLVIDGCIMLTERDEFIYHEMITHVPLYVHQKPENILVIGGGDGGTVREIIKHPEVMRVDLVDIDKKVSEVSLQYLPTVSNKLVSEKVNCHFEDGVKYVKDVSKKYDIIIVDSTDPVNVSEGLFTPEFYQDCFVSLRGDGLLVNQAESPAFAGDWVRLISKKLKNIFPKVFFYSANIPTYPSGYWLFGFASKKYHPLNHFQKNRFIRDKLKLNYYNSDIHNGAFCLPNYVKELINDK